MEQPEQRGSTKQSTSSIPKGPQVAVHPQTALVDEVVHIWLRGFPPNQPITLRARMTDSFGGLWEAEAVFQSDAQGQVDVAAQAPIGGSYSTPDPMGLIWSMLPGGNDPTAQEPREPLAPIPLHLAAEVQGQPLAKTTISRLPAQPAIQRRVVRERGLVGTLFQPAQPAPGILLLGGSEGGLHENDAAVLASHGYAVLALAYFGMEGVPETLVNIPLEYFATAIAWLQKQPGMQAQRLGVLGGSRGGELALLLGATLPEITAVVSYAGSGVITQGIGEGDLLEKVTTHQPSWTDHGEPLPFLPSQATDAFVEQVRSGDPVALTPVYLAALSDMDALEAATIPVERINGPVLLISGGDDQIWPSGSLSRIAMDRLTRHQHPYPDQYLYYEQAGHGIIPPPYGPTTLLEGPGPGVTFRMGGNAQDNALARADAWAHVLNFFAQHLQQK